MIRRPGGYVLLAILLLLCALGVDWLWYRVQVRALHRVEAAYRLEADRYRQQRSQAVVSATMDRYLEQGSGEEEDWTRLYRSRDPLQLLENIRKSAGVRRVDLRLLEREARGAFTETNYFMIVSGEFPLQLAFLKALELSAPMVAVKSFVIEESLGGADLDLRLNVSVLTLGEEGASK